ncbi:MAG: outer membrane protein assembly factor BamA [Bryobacteraceae bacterium]
MHFRSGRWPLILLALLASTHLSPLAASPGDFEGKRIVAIAFEPAAQPLLPVELQKKVVLTVGQPLRMEDVRLAISQLYATGRYQDITVDAEMSGEGVALKFITVSTVFIREVTVTGVPEPPNAGQLATATKLQLGNPFSESQVRRAVESLLEVLRANGFYQATVASEKLMRPSQQIDVHFSVESGNRARFTTPVVKGNPGRPVDQIIKAARWRKFLGFGDWASATDARVQNGLDRIRRSYQKKDFLMAKVTLDQMNYQEDSNRVVPVLDVDGGSRVLVEVAGAKVSTGKLKQLVPIYQEQSVDKDLLMEGKRNISEFMESKGYFDSDVNFDMTTNDKHEQVIEYLIDRGDRHKLVAIEISGNKYFTTPTLRERMYLTPANLLQFRHGRYSSSYLKRDVNAIKDLYESNGFRDVEVASSTEDDYKGKTDDVAVFLKIKEGPQITVGKLDLEGVRKEYLEEIQGLLRSSEGQPYSDLNVVNDQETVLNYYFNRGFPDAAFDSTIAPSAGPNQMDVKFVIQEGDRQFVRDVLVSGLKATDPDLVRNRIRNLNPGEPLSQSSMTDSQRRLYDLGIFARVDVALQNPDGDEDYKNVLYRLEEGRKYSIVGGIGAQVGRIGSGTPSTFDSPAGAPGFSPRVSFGINRSNAFGLGHTASILTRLSNIQKRVVFSYVAPQFKGDDRVNLSFTGIYDDSRDITTFHAKRQEGFVQLGQKLTKANTVQYRVGYRHVSVDQNSLQISPALIPILSQPVQLTIASATFVQDRRDDPSDSRKGIYNSLDAAFATNFFGTKTTFTRVLGRNSTYHRITRDVVLARSTSFGVETKLSTVEIPLPERFFAGGSSSHRGFPDNQAGPRDLITGFPIGGTALLLNNVELRFPLIGDNLRGVVFHDAGNVYSQLGKVSFRYNQKDITDFNYMVHALGFGIRYRTPVGPIRIDLGYSLNPPNFSGYKGSRDQLYGDPSLLPSLITQQQISHFQFHFSLGQAF